MPPADRILAALASRTAVGEPVALLAAHPDDEVIGAGGSLHLFRRLLIVHLTDGAPRNLQDARTHGFADAAAYAAARREELGRALAGLPAAFAELGAADQGATAMMPELAAAFRRIAAGFGAAAVLTHPYEGGHPDHDAAAFVAAASGLPVLEFASYHAGAHGGMATGAFLPGPASIRVELSAAEQARKQAMLACFATQAATLAPFGAGYELFRAAPRYDFSRPPHDGMLHYERYDWGMTGARWRDCAARA